MIQVQSFGTRSRYELEILYQRRKRIKTKSQKVLGANGALAFTEDFRQITEAGVSFFIKLVELLLVNFK